MTLYDSIVICIHYISIALLLVIVIFPQWWIKGFEEKLTWFLKNILFECRLWKRIMRKRAETIARYRIERTWSVNNSPSLKARAALGTTDSFEFRVVFKTSMDKKEIA